VKYCPNTNMIGEIMTQPLQGSFVKPLLGLVLST